MLDTLISSIMKVRLSSSRLTVICALLKTGTPVISRCYWTLTREKWQLSRLFRPRCTLSIQKMASNTGRNQVSLEYRYPLLLIVGEKTATQHMKPDNLSVTLTSWLNPLKTQWLLHISFSALGIWSPSLATREATKTFSFGRSFGGPGNVASKATLCMLQMRQ